MDEPTALSPEEPAHKDRSTGLIVFGILELLFGVLCLMMGGLLVFIQSTGLSSSGAGVSTNQIIPGILFYVAGGAVFLWLGIGAIRLRRWGRTLSLALAWLWLAAGVISIPMMAWVMPKAMKASMQVEGANQIPEGMVGMIIVFQLFFMAIFMILIPAVMVWFFRSPDTKATCEAADPKQPWCDRCSLPVLILSIVAWNGALFSVIGALSGTGVFPLFGSLLTGLPGTLGMVVLAALMGWAGLQVYRGKMVGWWVITTLIVLLCLSQVITIRKIGMAEFYEQIGYDMEQLKAMGDLSMWEPLMTWGMAAWLVPGLAFLIWVRKFLR